jgi:hypothetical protein
VKVPHGLVARMSEVTLSQELMRSKGIKRSQDLQRSQDLRMSGGVIFSPRVLAEPIRPTGTSILSKGHAPCNHLSMDFADLLHKLVNIEMHPTTVYEARNLVECLLGEHATVATTTISINTPHVLVSNLIEGCKSITDLAKIAKALSPLFFLEGCCLQNTNMAGFHHTLLSAKVLKIYMSVWGYSEPMASSHHFYDTILRIMR